MEKQERRSAQLLPTLMQELMDYHDQLARMQIGGEKLPHDLHEAHARLSERERRLMNREKNEKFRTRRHLLAWMRWKYKGMFIRPIDSAEEIVREGEEQDNCVAGYANRHADGKTIIMVLRKCSEPRKPWHTVDRPEDTGMPAVLRRAQSQAHAGGCGVYGTVPRPFARGHENDKEVSISENVVAVRSIEIVTAEITMIRDNARKVFLESVIQIGTRLEEAKQMVPSGEWTAYLTDKLGYKPSTAQNYMRIAREFGGGQVSLTGKTAAGCLWTVILFADSAAARHG